MINLYIFGLITSVIGEAGIATDIIKTGDSLGSMTAPAILGVVALASIFGLVKVYIRNQQQSDETITLLKDCINKNTEVLRELKDNCVKKSN